MTAYDQQLSQWLKRQGVKDIKHAQGYVDRRDYCDANCGIIVNVEAIGNGILRFDMRMSDSLYARRSTVDAWVKRYGKVKDNEDCMKFLEGVWAEYDPNEL